MLDLLRALLVPPACLACRTPLPRAGDTLCAPCRHALPWLPPEACPRCALPLPCGPPCPAHRAAFDRAYAPFSHDGPARTLVAALKFRGTTATADLMAAHLAANAPRSLLAGAHLVAVPPHPVRRRRRGFDHAQLLARALARRSGLPLAEGALQRAGPVTRSDARQLGASRARRRAQARHEVHARTVPGPRIVLVDDVHTTGATLDACARALRARGARRVAALTYTRALP